MNEPEKVTYGYINTEPKNINSVTFQNFQKLFIENDMTWRNKKASLFIPSELQQEQIELSQ